MHKTIRKTIALNSAISQKVSYAGPERTPQKMDPRRWRVMGIVVLLVATYSRGVSAECKCSGVDKSFRQMLSRKKRFVVFPKTSTILLTPSFTKALITGYPRGLVTSVEIDIYHPLPDTLDGWRPKIFDNSGTVPPPPTNKKKVVMMHPVSNYPIVGQEKWPAELEWGHGDDGEEFDFSWYPPTSSHKKWYSDFSTKSIPGMLPSAWTNNRWIYEPRNNVETATEEEEDWMHFRPHRERREIYSNLEDAASLLGFSIKSCILRTICEARHSLLPPGKSFIQDVIRILFVIPSKEEWTDEYSLTARSDNKNCSFRFKNECPISIIEFLMHGDRVI